jgi:uncharacterized protein YdeI (YjbR/CyaY-like superfamily)
MTAIPHDEREQVHVESAADWRAWLAANHARSAGVWLVAWKASTGRPRPTYDETVEEALCFGWIDAKARSLDDQRSAIWMAPRRRGSGWARSNKERILRLEAEGRMTDAGRALIESAKADGSWTRLDDVEDLVVPHDLAAAFADRPGSRDRWEAFPRSVKRASLVWLVDAKSAATRASRIAEIAEKTDRGERPR